MQCFKFDYFVDGLLTPLKPSSYDEDVKNAEFQKFDAFRNQEIKRLEYQLRNSLARISCESSVTQNLFDHHATNTFGGLTITNALMIAFQKNYATNYPTSCIVSFHQPNWFLLKTMYLGIRQIHDVREQTANCRPLHRF